MFFSNFAKNEGQITVRDIHAFTYLAILQLLLLCGCNYKLKPFAEEQPDTLEVKVQRYDRMESLYLTTGDFSALQQMSTEYANETRTLIENVLNLGTVDDPEINNKFLRFFQDSTLQAIIAEAEMQYANTDDLNAQLSAAFHKLKQMMPDIKIPIVYAQICALDQSIVVGDGSIGICLDKYLGADYPIYQKYYNLEQRKTMTREHIVPDFLSFYLVTSYPLENFSEASQEDLMLHWGKVQWVVNKIIGKKFFKTEGVNRVDRYMAKHPNTSVYTLLTSKSTPI